MTDEPRSAPSDGEGVAGGAPAREPGAPDASRERLRSLPKAELHVHLDGSLRPATMLELARERDVPLPAADPAALAEAMLVRDAASLEEYLEPFERTLALMQDAGALERIAYELAADHAAENVRYAEVRFCPLLCTEGGLGVADALDVALAGFERGRAEHGVETRVTVSALRTLSSAASREMAELAVAYRTRGVCAFDLAGAEAGHPVHDHVDALTVAARADLPVTIHAGEGYGPSSIREALELGRARRIGHGTRLGEDAELLGAVRDAGVTLEVCLTSNVQTRVARSYAEHPMRGYFDAGVRVSLCTDNRLMSGVTLTEEYAHAEGALGFGWDELVRVARTGFESAFVEDGVRSTLLEELEREVQRLG